MIFPNKFLVCSGLLAFIYLNSNGQSISDYTNSLKYADYLFQTKQFNFSILEYERIVFQEPHDTLAKLKLVQSYRFLQDYITAQEKFERLFPANRANISECLASEYIKVLLLNHEYNSAQVFLQLNSKIRQPIKAEYQIGTLLLQCRWKDAKLLAEEHVKIDPKSIEIDKLYNIALSGMDINYKNPMYAAVLSSIIPGSGKLYTNQWKDALYSFLLIGASSWMTYFSVKNDGVSFNGILLGTITLSLYAANIYGSFKSGEKYNRKMDDKYKYEVENIIFRE